MLTLYRRHRETCHVHQTKLSAAAKRRYMDCECPIWIYGNTADGHVPRQSVGTTEQPVAEAQRQALLKNAEPKGVYGIRIDDAIERYVVSREHELNPKIAASYRFQLDRLCTYCAACGVHHMQALTVDMLENFKVDGLPKDMADTTKQIVVSKLRCFLRDALRRGWIKEPLAERVKGHEAEHEEKSPYEENELPLILNEAGKLKRGREGYASEPETFRLLLELMLETGLRVSDAIRYDPARTYMGESGLWPYPYAQRKRKRTKKPVLTEAYLTDRLKTAIDKCKWLSPKLPFWYGEQTADRGYKLSYQVYDLMQQIGSRCDVPDCRPHRLRDTFAVRALLRGMQLDDVSRLLGHSSVKITESYYARFVPARRNRLEGVLAQSLMRSPNTALGD